MRLGGNFILHIALLILLVGCSTTFPQRQVTNDQGSPFQRKYIEGEKIKYRIQMTHFFDGRETSSYDVQASGSVKKNAEGLFYEEFTWFSVLVSAKKMKLSLEDQSFVQKLSLTPAYKLSIPQELPKLSSFMIGPVTDFLTFYVDQYLTLRQPALQKVDDHVFLNTAVLSSWGPGQDCLDFDIVIKEMDRSKQVGIVKVSHLPPSAMCIMPVAKWMENKIFDTPNNWFNLEHKSKMWTASVGKEVFDVELKIDLKTGIILSATMDNPVDFQSRNCKDQHLTECSEPKNHKIIRHLKMTLLENKI